VKNLWMNRLILILTALIIALLPACDFTEDKGTVENVGTPVAGEGDFTVTQPDVGTGTTNPDTENGSSGNVSNPPANEWDPVFLISIDGGQPFTHSEQIKLSILTNLPTFLNYKISSNDNCTGGTWAVLDDSLTAEITVTNFIRNARNNYSILFKDVDGLLADCVKTSIIHDNKGPDILFTKYPMVSLEEGSSAEIIFQVTDVSPISSVVCKMNSIVKNCLAGTNNIQLSQLPAGDYNFSVTATDSHGYSSTQSVTWTVVNKAKFLTQTILVKDDRKVDILVVIDNSGSMAYEQQSMGNRVKNMLTILRGLDYRIAVTTTDPRPTSTFKNVTYYGDGDLIPISGQGSKLWIDSDMNESTAQQALSATLQRPETGYGIEQAILATYRFIEKSTTLKNGAPTIPFFRDGAKFATLVISDEDESANTSKNDPENLLKLISSTFNNQKTFSWHSIITKPGDSTCRSTYGATYGERYKILTELTGGILGSVCEADYAAQVSGIATAIRDMVKNLTLTCTPLNTVQVKVAKDGVPYTGAFTIDGVNLKFADVLDPGQYTIDYACLK
jgi:hypothetical protein